MMNKNKKKNALNNHHTNMMDFNTRVATPYGDGRLMGYREHDGMFVVQLLGLGGILYCRREVLSRNPMHSSLDVAFDALEQMRKLNLEIECTTTGIAYDKELCTTCLLDKGPTTTTAMTTTKPTTSAKPKNAANMICVVCGNPTCCRHQSKGFKKQKVVLCHTCETLFDLDFYQIVHGVAEQRPQDEAIPEEEELQLTTPLHQTLAHQPNPVMLDAVIQHMLDTYDRVMLLLARDSQYIPELQVHLMNLESRNNHIGAGTSATSAVGCVLGITGAAMILTPFGLPLLMASLAVSCTSSAVSLGNDAVNWYQQPHKAADRILVLHGLACAILKAAQSLLDVAAEMEMNQDKDNGGSGHKYADDLGQGLTVVRNTNTALAITNMAATNSPALQAAYPTTTASLSQSTAWVASVPLLGAALSSIFLVMDASRLQYTLSKIQAGNVSEKAVALQKIQGDLLVFPPSTELEQQTQFCLKVIKHQWEKEEQQQQQLQIVQKR